MIEGGAPCARLESLGEIELACLRQLNDDPIGLMPTLSLTAQFFLQAAVILAACRAVGWLARRAGQPEAVGEMVAGVLIGPSLLGWWWPGLQARLFPPDAMPLLHAISQVGLALYMFLVGVEFQTSHFKERVRTAASVSLAGMIVPFVLGAGLASLLLDRPDLFGPDVSRGDAMLFLGAAMSITAFPMLARILHERGLSETAIGTLALAAAAIDDAAAWCILALVLANLSGDAAMAAVTVGGGVLYAAFVLTAGQRIFAPLGRRAEKDGEASPSLLAVTLIVVLLGAWFTDTIGIHAVFGAFILGVAMPRGTFAKRMQEQLRPLVTVFMLPLFFVYSGLNTRLDLVVAPPLLGIGLLILAVACIGKGVACWAAARLHGAAPREALAIGTLMNARGLTGLIILDIGLQRGLITPTLFTLMALMAIGTTLMATPLFRWFYEDRVAPTAGDAI